ncbi:MAG: phosphoribosyl-AMP cyclohydrolase [Aestuariivirga sp.]
MSKSDLDESLNFTPRFDAAGLIAAIVQDAVDGTVLMFAHMNAEALQKTRETGLAHFYSRSRGKLWLKGESSGETFAVAEMRVDCDMDCVLLKVTPQGPKGVACHTGRRSCFYRRVGATGLVMI